MSSNHYTINSIVLKPYNHNECGAPSFFKAGNVHNGYGTPLALNGPVESTKLYGFIPLYLKGNTVMFQFTFKLTDSYQLTNNALLLLTVAGDVKS